MKQNKQPKLSDFGFPDLMVNTQRVKIDGSAKMDLESEKQKAGTPPDFKNDGVAVWINKDKNGKQYLSIQLLGKNGLKVNAFKFEEKKE